jgi:hypothetical protein
MRRSSRRRVGRLLTTVASVTAKDILLAVIIPLALAELGPWCGWLAARLLPLAAKLRYGDTERAVVRLEEWSGDLNDIPGQLTKLAYAIGQLAAGSAVSLKRNSKTLPRRTKLPSYIRLTYVGPLDIVVSLLLAAWRWRYEIVLVSSLSAALTSVLISFGALPTIIATVIVVIAITLTILYWPTVRLFAVGLAWCIITPHRVRVGCTEGLIYSTCGKMPIILLTSRQAFGERVLLWCRAGTSVDDFISARAVLTAACWAQDVTIFAHARYAQLVTLDIIRRPAYAISG